MLILCEPMVKMNQSEVKVRFRFKGQTEIYRAVMTITQFDNFRVLPAVSLCEKVDELGEEVDKQTEEDLEKKLAEVFKKDKSHEIKACFPHLSPGLRSSPMIRRRATSRRTLLAAAACIGALASAGCTGGGPNDPNAPSPGVAGVHKRIGGVWRLTGYVPEKELARLADAITRADQARWKSSRAGSPAAGRLTASTTKASTTPAIPPSTRPSAIASTRLRSSGPGGR